MENCSENECETGYGYIENTSTNEKYVLKDEHADDLFDPTKRIYDSDYKIHMKVLEGLETRQIGSDFLANYENAQTSDDPFELNEVISRIDSVDVGELEELRSQLENNGKLINEALHEHNRLLNERNIKLSSDIERDMSIFHSNIENHPTELTVDDNNRRIANIQELKRKMQDSKLLVKYRANHYVLWSVAGIAAVIILLSITKKMNK